MDGDKHQEFVEKFQYVSIKWRVAYIIGVVLVVFLTAVIFELIRGG